MRRAGARLRRTEILLLLALRTGRRSVEEEGGLRRPRRFGPGPIRTPAADGGLPSEGGARVRPTAGEGRGPDRGAYLHLEVRCIAGVGRSGPRSKRSKCAAATTASWSTSTGRTYPCPYTRCV